MREAPIPEDVAWLMEERLKPREGFLRIEEVTRRYPWAEQHRLFCGWNHAGQALSAAQAEGEAPLALGPERGIDALGEVLVRERGSLPGGLLPGELARAVRRLTVSPTGLVAVPDAVDLPLQADARFLGGDIDAQERARRALCQAPVLHDLGQGRWMLRFLYWTTGGGVELWDVVGDPGRIHAAETRFAAPPGSFRWPFR